MSVHFSPAVAGQVALESEADAKRRIAAAEAAEALAPPSSETEEWRYSPINDFVLDAFEPASSAPTGAIVPEPVASVVPPAASVTVVNGWVQSIEVAEAADGLTVEIADSTTRAGFADPDLFDRLHEAFAPPALRISVAANKTIHGPVVIRNHHTGGGTAAFAHVIVHAAANAEVDVVEYQTSAADAGLSVPVVELDAADAARLRYVTVQELGTELVQLGRVMSTVGSQAQLVAGIAAFGGSWARVRTDTHLAGRGASGELVSIYYADGDQVHDFRTFQHHDAPDTVSDLLFKGTIDDTAGSIYTGLIHIHPDGRGSNAHQTNRNVKLSDDAWAWSVPNLEIENNEVRCSHASTVSPIDLDQQFYLHARGVEPALADRLIVSGFFSEVLERFPGVGLREEVRRLVEEKLDRREVGVGSVADQGSAA